MRVFSITVVLTVVGLALAGVPYAIAQSSTANIVPAHEAVPAQLGMRVPFDPTAFRSGGQTHLLYELHITNFGFPTFTLNRIEVLDADASAAKPIAVFEADELNALLQSVGQYRPANPRFIAAGSTVIVFMSVTFDRGVHVPNRLLHRVAMAETGSAVEGAVIGTHHTKLRVLGPPVEGANWLAADGPSNDADNHHRRGIFVVDGSVVISRRYAIDWKQVEDGESFFGDARDPQSYYAYGKAVLAVADARVVTARDGLPDNVPGHDKLYHPAVPITMETIAGNTVTLDLGGGQFAYYLHMQPDSVRVKPGDHVRRGQLLGLVGCSGDAREPHLHFEVTTSPKLMAGEGVPYLIDQYHLTADGVAELRRRELPLNKNIVDFGGDHAK